MPSNDYFSFSTANFPKRGKIYSATFKALVTTLAAAFALFPSLARLLAGVINYATTAGTSTAFTASLANITAYTDGVGFRLKMHLACGDNPTLNVSSLGARNMLRPDGSAIQEGDLGQYGVYDFAYNGTDDTIRVMSLMPDTVQSATPTYTTIVTTQSIQAPVIYSESMDVAISSGTLTLDCSATTAFNVAMDQNITVIDLTNLDAAQSQSFTIEFDNIGSSFTFGEMLSLPDGFTIYKSDGETLTINADAITVYGFVIHGANIHVWQSLREVIS